MNKDRTNIKRWGRWVGTFIGFPLAGLAARAFAGNVDSVGAAALAGFAGGAVLGSLQASIGGIKRSEWVRWIAATSSGLTVGLALGASTVGYRTDTASLAMMGAFSGAGVGLAQALALPSKNLDRVMWAIATPVLWAGGWLITAQVITDVERQHAVFGASGALMVSALAGVLYAKRDRTPLTAVSGAHASIRSAVTS